MTFDLLAVWLVRLLAIYAGAGFLFALAFLAHGLERVDSNTAGATLGFRLVVLPATIAFWPWLLLRWRRSSGRPPIEVNAHRRGAARQGGSR